MLFLVDSADNKACPHLGQVLGEGHRVMVVRRTLPEHLTGKYVTVVILRDLRGHGGQVRHMTKKAAQAAGVLPNWTTDGITSDAIIGIAPAPDFARFDRPVQRKLVAQARAQMHTALEALTTRPDTDTEAIKAA